LLLRLPLQVACICDPSYPEKHKIERQWSSQPGQKERPPPHLQNNQSTKGWRCDSSCSTSA
jgi:hypothetical protein